MYNGYLIYKKLFSVKTSYSKQDIIGSSVSDSL